MGYWRNVRTPNEHPHGHASASHPNPDRAAALLGNEFSKGEIREGQNNERKVPGAMLQLGSPIPSTTGQLAGTRADDVRKGLARLLRSAGYKSEMVEKAAVALPARHETKVSYSFGRKASVIFVALPHLSTDVICLLARTYVLPRERF